MDDVKLPCRECKHLLKSPTRGICKDCFDLRDPTEFKHFEAGDWFADMEKEERQ